VSTTYIRNTIAFAINHFGEASHPYADEQSLPSFKQHYAIKCVDAAVENGDLESDNGDLCEAYIREHLTP
jgi:hypothetical protein